MITDKSLAQAGFKPKTAIRRKRIVMSIEGLDKTGKTHLALTAPGTIAYFGLDIGDEGVIEKFIDAGKEIITPDDEVRVPNIVEMERDGPKVDATMAMDKLKKAHLAACNSSQVRSIIWDTETEVWELIRLARFGKLSQVISRQYEPVNAEMRGLLRAAYDSDKNFILIHKMKDEYVNDKRTGKYKRSGFGDTRYIVQANLTTFYDEEAREFGVKVLNCRQNMSMSGQIYTGELCTFPMLATMMIGGSAPEDWM